MREPYGVGEGEKSFFDIWKEWVWGNSNNIQWLTNDDMKNCDTVCGIAGKAFDPLAIAGAMIYGAWKAYKEFKSIKVGAYISPRILPYTHYPYYPYPSYPYGRLPYVAYGGGDAHMRGYPRVPRRGGGGVIIVPTVPDLNRFEQIYRELINQLRRI